MGRPDAVLRILLLLGGCLVLPRPVYAQSRPPADAGSQATGTEPGAKASSKTPPPRQAPEAPDDGPTEAAPAVETSLAERAAQLRDLLRGRLDPEVDADDLLRLSVDEVPALPELWAQAQLPRGRREPRSDPDEAAFVDALGRFLALPEARRARLLAQHRDKHAAYLAARAASERMRETLARLTDENERLSKWLAGELSPERDVEGLLRLDLVPPELPQGLDPEARALREAVSGAYGRRLELIERYLALSPQERRALAASHAHEQRQYRERQQAAAARATDQAARAAERVSESEDRADDVARERQAALQAASRARSEAQRLFASEWARLLGEKEAVARAEAELSRREQALGTPRELALGFQRRVQEIGSRSVLAAGTEQDADRLYVALREALTEQRAALRDALVDWRSGRSLLPSRGTGADTSLLDEADRAKLARLNAQIDTRYAELRAREQELWQQRARTLNEAVDRMNRSRLRLLQHMSSSRRAELLGFGPEGVGQLRREIDQLMLSTSYHLMTLPHDLQGMVVRAKVSSVSIVFALLQLIAALALFRVWRANGDRVLASIEGRAAGAPFQSMLRHALGSAAWYLRRIRRPLEWLLLLWLIFNLVGNVEALPELEFLWLASLWVTIGWAAVLLLDAMAVRRHLVRPNSYESPELRIRTLRAIAMMVVLAGLVLAWTHEGVGAGTVYRWVKLVCLLLAIPLVVVLLHWWRVPVRKRLEDTPEDSSLVRWCLRQRGVRTYLATLVGSLYLMAQGALRVLMRQAARFEWMQRALAYLFRSQVKRQAQAQSRRLAKRPLASAETPSLRPGYEAPEWLEDVAAEQLARVAEQVEVGSSLSVVVAERGMGRSAFLRRLTDRIGADAVLCLSCPLGGVEEFQEELTRRAVERTGAASASTSVAALSQSPIRVVCVDDVQRVVKPAVGGLDSFEHFVDVAQQHDPGIAWVFTITASAWVVVSRARESAAGFDTVVSLPRWTEKQIRTLLQQRTELEDIEPSFDELIVPRQLDVEETLDPLERTRLAYYRILWDYSGGNPSVALHFWRSSLYRDAEDHVIVHLFDPPPARDIEELPSSMHFILRAVVQLDQATPEAVADCTALPGEVVRDGLELALRKGYLERSGDELSITLDWFRTITTVLRRQHLLLS